MWGLPGQTTSQALQDLELAVELKPDHISWYQLTIEPNTIFASSKPRLPNEHTQCSMETSGSRVLKKAGYERYEVSAFAKQEKRADTTKIIGILGLFWHRAGAHGKLTKLRSRGENLPNKELNSLPLTSRTQLYLYEGSIEL